MLGLIGDRYLRHAGPEHVMAFAPTRSGKGVGVDATVADRCLNHVGSATTSKIMRTYNQSELCAGFG